MSAPKSPLAEMRASIQRLKEKTELLAAQTVMARTEEEPETESQRLRTAHARFRTAILTTTARMVDSAQRTRRRIRRQALNPLQTTVKEAVHAKNDAPTQAKPRRQ